MKNIVIIGGGTGTSTLLSGLKKYPVKLSVIVSSWDDGGSNGRLRTELNAFPFSDARQCLAALAENKEWKKFFLYRFDSGKLKGHTAANLFLAHLQKLTGSVQQSIKIAAELLHVKGNVLPATLSPGVLTAELADGRKIVGEHVIDNPRRGKFSPIQNLELLTAKPNPEAVEAVRGADVLVFGPGDLFTSVLPNLLAPGIGPAVLESNATKVFVGNLVTKDGQTNGFKASDFILAIMEYLPDLDYAILNKQKPSKQIMQKYRKDKSEVVELDKELLKQLNVHIILENLLLKQEFKKIKGDVLKRSFLRHDSKKLSKIIWNISKN